MGPARLPLTQRAIVDLVVRMAAMHDKVDFHS
jgi:hypothetical protein